MPDSNVDVWKDKRVSELMVCAPPTFSLEESERHSIYSYALMAITHHYWNGNKYGREFRYPMNTVEDPTLDTGTGGDTYLGHNIAALAVQHDGRIIDFDFNHNELFNSSVEHAESRLLRRLFSLTRIQESWREIPNAQLGSVVAATKNSYGNLLSKVTLYTTLESCAQCSGIMALAKLLQVVFLQTDPGQYSVGNIMRNMTVGTGLPSPQPIPATSFKFSQHAQLDNAYSLFKARPKSEPMVTERDGKSTKDSGTTSITSFLCTKAAQRIFLEGSNCLKDFKPTYPDYRPKEATPDGITSTEPLTNREVLHEARSFVDYAIQLGQRGTPHRA